MINIHVPNIDDTKLLDAIIKKKNTDNKIILTSIQDVIINGYNDYENSKFNLETITPYSGFIEGEEEILKNSYKSGQDISAVKKKIKDDLPISLRGTCPYCMISEPSTLDHYLDKSTFPEYSLYTKNLIPCCYKCNNKKGNAFLDNQGNRMTINFYYDNFLRDNFLKIRLDSDADGIPYIKDIVLNFSEDKDSNIIIENHFYLLNLKERYTKQVSDYLVTIIELYNRKDYPQEKIIEDLADKIYVLEKTKGPNYWLISLYKAIKSNQKILDLMV